MITDKNEKNIVWNAMIILFLSLLIVYVIRYQSNRTTNQEKATPQSITDTLIITESQQTGIILSDPNTEITETPITNSGLQTTSNTDLIENTQSGTQTDIIIIETGTTDQSMNILSGTTLYFGPIEGIDTLGIVYDYALRDDKNIYMVSLGQRDPDLSAIARSLGGSLYTINTETEIVSNQLFGKRIIFINLPEYKDILVLMYVEVGGEKWLLQIPYSIYHESKRYLQDLFTN